MQILNRQAFKMICIIGLAVLFCSFMYASTAPLQETDADTCLGCHKDFAKTFQSEPHGALNSCTACHGDAEKHMVEGGGAGNVFAFGAQDVSGEKTQKCLACHAKGMSRYMAGPHGKSAMDCTTCHSVHHQRSSTGMLKAGAMHLCSSCHEDVSAQFQLNERHRLQEGILTCVSCHNPHEPAVRERLGGFKHQACLRCHTDKGGPYLYEHGASRIEGCTACHETHGSPNRHMLKNQSISDLCFSCHAGAPSWHSRFSSQTTNCTVCHSAIHGSNLSHLFLK